MPRKLVLMGPQRHAPSVKQVLDELGVEGPVATVTAGWQERESELEEMSSHLDRPVINLLLHQRGEEVFAADPDLAEAYRARQDRLKDLQQLYRLRLDFTLGAARALMERQGDMRWIGPERRSAVAEVRRLDSHHLSRVARVHDAFEEAAEPESSPPLVEHREKLGELLDGASALAIAGGHVAVLLNRLRLFGVLDLAPRLPVVAWSAGAMALARRVVLFHDRPPQGAGNAEVLENGLGLYENLVPLPHASRRLSLDDPQRVALFARRFGPAATVTLDPGDRLDCDGEEWVAGAGVRRLTRRGRVEAIGGETLEEREAES